MDVGVYINKCIAYIPFFSAWLLLPNMAGRLGGGWVADVRGGETVCVCLCVYIYMCVCFCVLLVQLKYTSVCVVGTMC